MSIFQPAVKERLLARIAIDGPTGSGKSWTALQWARVLAGPIGRIGGIDTENRSLAYYAPTPAQLAGTEPMDRLNWWDPPYEFGHAPMTPPYDPRQLGKLIDAAAADLSATDDHDAGVLIIDSLTHYWNGEGGTLDIVDDASSRSGNSFTGWKEGTPAQRYMLDKIIHAPFHVIVTMRSKMEYVLEEQVKNGKKILVPKKLGMAPEQRAGIEYEFTVVADMDLEHRLVISKSRCSTIADMVMPSGRSVEPAQAFAAWLNSGVERVAAPVALMITERMNAITDEAKRKAIKELFVSEFGRPTELTTDRVAEVNDWLAVQCGDVAPTGVVPADTPVIGALADAVADLEADDTAADDQGQ